MENNEKLIAELSVRIKKAGEDEPFIESNIDGSTEDVLIAFTTMCEHISDLGIPEHLIITAFQAGVENSSKRRKTKNMS